MVTRPQTKLHLNENNFIKWWRFIRIQGPRTTNWTFYNVNWHGLYTHSNCNAIFRLKLLQEHICIGKLYRYVIINIAVIKLVIICATANRRLCYEAKKYLSVRKGLLLRSAYAKKKVNKKYHMKSKLLQRRVYLIILRLLHLQ